MTGDGLEENKPGEREEMAFFTHASEVGSCKKENQKFMSACLGLYGTKHKGYCRLTIIVGGPSFMPLMTVPGAMATTSTLVPSQIISLYNEREK